MNVVIIKPTDTKDDVSLKGSVLLQAEVNAHKRTALQRDTALMHLSNFLDETEGAFCSDEHFASTEHAQRYVDAAKWMKNYFGRPDSGVIADVEKWIFDELIGDNR